ncbi:hypothetical protein DPMN_165355 [Dreissena polymorpha]|uniref:Uncharacterized protein n=1 Tax=Dreissena polymorpha TaxID=45954 RepID=A0A9D4IUI8_DREPO|nr:hypothetical protein DPMN_165355 [Dreissena polymorpha]
MVQDLGWRSLADRRNDSKLIMLYKIYHNLVAIPLQQNIKAPIRFTRHMHPLYLQKIQAGSLYHY